jgi:hypothetical protein
MNVKKYVGPKDIRQSVPKLRKLLTLGLLSAKGERRDTEEYLVKNPSGWGPNAGL